MTDTLLSESPAVTAAEVARGTSRLFRRADIFVQSEVGLRNHRRCDLMGINAKGEIIIVEIKCARADLLGDQKWTEYLEYCDRFFWAVPLGFDTAPLNREAFLPDRTGLIIADGYDGEIARSAARHALAPARRKKETERLARTAMNRLMRLADPEYTVVPET